MREGGALRAANQRLQAHLAQLPEERAHVEGLLDQACDPTATPGQRRAAVDQLEAEGYIPTGNLDAHSCGDIMQDLKDAFS
jgi:hypothetical protein